MKSRQAAMASLILGGSAAVSLGAFPFSDTFGGGLLFHTAMAAAVGGLADWYAVNSLFRRPLGIGRGEGLIPDSRDKIIRMARDMMTKEILTVPRIYQVLKAHSLSAAFAVWLGANRDEAERLFQNLAGLVLEAVPARNGGEITGRALEAALHGEDWAARVLDVLKIWKDPQKEAALLRAAKAGGLLFLKEGFKDEDFLPLYQKAWALYEEKGMMRSMLRTMLQGQMGLSDEKAVQLIREKLAAQMETLDQPGSMLYTRVHEAGLFWMERLEKDEAFRKQVNDWIGERAAAWLGGEGSMWIGKVLEKQAAGLGAAAGEWMFSLLEETLSNSEGRKKLDRWILKRLSDYLPEINERIGRSIEAALGAYSGRDMAEQAEASVYADLQMIRINGSCIGALLGCLSYLAFYAASGGRLL